jgi:hypothetical protein
MKGLRYEGIQAVRYRKHMQWNERQIGCTVEAETDLRAINGHAAWHMLSSIIQTIWVIEGGHDGLVG